MTFSHYSNALWFCLSFGLSVAFALGGSLYADVFPGKKGFDRYGGYLAYKGTATGRFHTENIGGREFLVTPDGHGFLSIGVTHTEALAKPQDSRVDYFNEGLGGDWEKATAELLPYFQKWGYNSLGYGGYPDTRKRLPHFGWCRLVGDVSSWMGSSIKYPDVFSDRWKKEARKTLEEMANTFPETPNLIGVYWTDVPVYDFEGARTKVGHTWVDAIRELPDGAPGKKRYERFVREKGADASDEEFLVLIAREIYSHVGPITRELYPDTLIFGDRYRASLPWKVIQEALPWIDVVSVQPSGSEYPAANFERLYRETGKPIMICDHQVSFITPEHSNVMWHSFPDAATVGQSHAAYLNKGFSTPYLIGHSRCQYIDVVKDGRNYMDPAKYTEGQQILKQGLLQVDGKPNEELVKTVERNNWRIHERFLSKDDKAK